jgi:hypothetical protein
MIISVSRRSDIPRFYADWFMDRIRSGSVEVANPFNAKQIRTVNLNPAALDVLVFWTRDPRPLLPFLAELDERGYRYYFMTTLTGYPKEIEPGRVPVADIVDALSRLSDTIGSARSIWRYDPVFLSSVTDASFHLKNFDGLATCLHGKVERVIFSAYDEYKKTRGRVAALLNRGIEVYPAHDADGLLVPEAAKLLGDLAGTARARGIEPRSCAEADDLGRYGIVANACVDAELIKRLWGIEVGARKDRSQRPACRCAESVDIGAYDSCPAGCVYCYAITGSGHTKYNPENHF